MLQFSCSTCVGDTGVAPERVMRAHDPVYWLLPTANKDVENVGLLGGIMRSGATPVSTIQVEQGSCNIAFLRMNLTLANKKTYCLRSFSLANTACTGFKAELKMKESNGTYRSTQRSLNHHFSRLKRHFHRKTGQV